MNFLRSLNISGSALTAQKFRMDVISQNIANADTTRTQGGGPYRRKSVTLQTRPGTSFGDTLNGVIVKSVAEDNSELKPVYDPSHPDANAEGYVMMPNVDTVKEMVDMMSATRSYEANVTAFNAVKLMASKALEIGK